ncbi:MAG: cytochrome c family protein [Alphaproteobacteria bacterium]|nr:MAG: cytochrome c family protein [Alphaproteobacteria bacterium]
MSSLENNKIFAAILCVGITVMLTNFVADRVIVSEPLEKDAVAIDGAVASGHGAATPKKPKIPDPIMALLATADMEKGAKISKACAACHSFDKGGPVKQGPNLWSIAGANKGGKVDFSYSKGMQEAGGIWDYDSLNKFLTKPKKFISGTKMNFAGLKKAKDRAALVAWLRTQADAPFALPSDTDIAAEQTAFAPPPAEEEPHHDDAEIHAEEAAPEVNHH